MLGLGLLALVGSGIAFLIAWALVESANPVQWQITSLDIYGGMALLYSALALMDFFRSLRADLKGFLLVTPRNLVVCRGSHHPLRIFRLGEATAFTQTDKYSRATWTGREFVFAFGPKDRVHFTLKHAAALSALEEVIGFARALGRGEALPPSLDTEREDLGSDSAPGFSSGLALLDPGSTFWISTAAILLLLAFLGFFAAVVRS